MATLDLTGGAPTDDDVVAAAVSSSGRAEVIISAPASLEESIVAVLDPDQGQCQQFATQIARLLQVYLFNIFLKSDVRILLLTRVGSKVNVI